MRLYRFVLGLGVAAAVVLGLASCARGGGGAAGKTQSVTVVSSGMKFDPAVISTTNGTKLTITFENRDAVEHNLTIPQFNAKTPNVPAGKSATLEVVANKTGEFDVLCTIAGHRESGMLGKLSVK